MSGVGDSGPGGDRGDVPEPHGGPLPPGQRRPQSQADMPAGSAARASRQISTDSHPPLLDRQFDANSLDLLRAAIAAHAAAAGLSADRVYDAVIAAHELAANAVRHGAGHGRVRQWTDGQLLCCHVSDPGPARHRPARPGPQQPWPAEYGHGLWLVGQTADQVIMNHRPGDGTDVTISFAIDAAQRGTGPSGPASPAI